MCELGNWLHFQGNRPIKKRVFFYRFTNPKNLIKMVTTRNHLRGSIMARSHRVGLSLKPNVNSVITDLAQLTGHTKTSLINSILTKMLPSLTMSVEILQGTEKQNKTFHDEVGETLIGECADTFNPNQLKLEGLENHATK